MIPGTPMFNQEEEEKEKVEIDDEDIICCCNIVGECITCFEICKIL